MSYRPPKFKNEITLQLSRNESRCVIDDIDQQLGELGTDFVSRYPAHAELQALIADWIGVEPGRIVVTAGGDESIDRVMRISLAAEKKKIVSHEPSFEMVDIYAGNYGGELKPSSGFPAIFRSTPSFRKSTRIPRWSSSFRPTTPPAV